MQPFLFEDVLKGIKSLMTLLLVYGTLAIAISFICSVLEAVLLSITPSYVQSLFDKKPIVAKRLEALKERVDQPLAAILTLNTIAHTAGAAGGDYAAAEEQTQQQQSTMHAVF